MPDFLDRPIPESIIEACAAIGACVEGLKSARRSKCWRDLPAYICGWAATRAPGLTFEQRSIFLAQSDDPGWWAEMCATHAPGLTEEERAAIREEFCHAR